MNPRKALRALVEQPRYTIIPGAFDALSARLAQLAGFDAVYLTGGGYSRACGFPDIGLLTLTENLAFANRCVEAVDIPVIADADNGYGNATNVIRTVREFEKTGVAGFHLEDQVSPKKCGHYEGKGVIKTEEMVGKIKAAVDTRRDGDMVVIARTDTRAVEGFQAAVDRVNAYLEAGADVGFVEAPETADEVARLPQLVTKPLLINMFHGGKTPSIPARELERMGYRLGIYPSQSQRAAIRAVQEVLQVLKEDGDTIRIEDRLASFKERERVVNATWWSDRERRYLAD